MREMWRNARVEYEAKYTAERNYKMLIAVYRQASQEVREPLKSHRKVLRVAD
jgi:hypothetical protein